MFTRHPLVDGGFWLLQTYTLETAPHNYQTMSKEQDIDEIISSGDWSSMLEWLRKKSTWGLSDVPAELIESATGSKQVLNLSELFREILKGTICDYSSSLPRTFSWLFQH